jgi:hypothetical protein
MVKIYLHSIKSAPQSSINLKSGELFLASGQKSLSLTPVGIYKGLNDNRWYMASA